MTRPAKLTSNPPLILILTVLFCLLAFAVAARPFKVGAEPKGKMNGTPQDAWKVVKRSPSPDADEPIKIVKVRGKGKDLSLNEKFKSDDPDWLRDFTLTIENTSGKGITHINFALFFPPRANGSTTGKGSYTFELRYGLSPQSEHYAESRKHHPERVIKQKEKYDLSLTTEEYEHIRKVLTDLGYPPDIREVEIWISEVGFDDGTYQIGGQIFGPMGALKEIKKPTGEALDQRAFLVKAGFGTGAAAPVQSRCGGASSRAWIVTCSTPGCRLPEDRRITTTRLITTGRSITPAEIVRDSTPSGKSTSCVENLVMSRLTGGRAALRPKCPTPTGSVSVLLMPLTVTTPLGAAAAPRRASTGVARRGR